MRNKDYSVEISALYTIGKDFAFEWLESRWQLGATDRGFARWAAHAAVRDCRHDG